MPRENSFSDTSGRSLTPDLEDELAAVRAAASSAPNSPTVQKSPSPITTTATPVPPPLKSASIHSRTTNPASHRTRPNFSAKDKFRAAVRKVIQLHRGTSIIASRGVGAEPGIDPRRESAYINYGHIKQDCIIELTDYSAVRSSSGRMTNREFVDLLNDPGASAREPWVKVRWINIGGISWDVVSAVALKYDIHPLALEDVLHQRGQSRSKVDYYSKHLFLRILCHELGDPNELNAESLTTAPYGSTLTELPRSSSPVPFTENDITQDRDVSYEKEEHVKGGEADGLPMYNGSSTSPTKRTRWRRPLLPHNRRDIEGAVGPRSELTKLAGMQRDIAQTQQKHVEQVISIEELKKGERVNVKVSPMYIFLFRDGTVISMHPTPQLSFTAPITARLRQRDTGLRTSADAALLVQSLLDLIVDQALEVIDEYHVKIKMFEHAILLKPKMKTVRQLHILSGDLILHKRTLEPIKTIIYGLRRYDVDRCAALVDLTAAAQGDVKVVGFMSHKAKIYLADVFDHMEYILTSLDMFAGIAENLIDYTFNMASYEMNEVIRRLTLTTIIFLPLTFLTGYFGMNFDSMWTVHHDHSDVIFWIIALPVMAILLPIFIAPDVTRMIHFVQKKMATKNAIKTFKQA